MRQRTLAEQHANWCINFTGFMAKTCKAGVVYDSFDDLPGQGLERYPCFRDSKSPNPCAHCSYPTPEESQAYEAQAKRGMRDMFTARAAIVAHTEGKRGVSGEIECPLCKGRLRFSVAGVNGHIHAACSNKECVRWME